MCNPSTFACERTPEGRASDGIRTARAGKYLPVTIDGALVTGVVPRNSSYASRGFFIQAEREGPGLFVAVDPDELAPAVQLGDRVRLTVTQTRVSEDGTEALSISGYERLATGQDIAPLVQDVSHRNDLIDNRYEFDDEVLAVEGDLLQDFLQFRPGQYFASIETKGGFHNSKFGVIVNEAVVARVSSARDCHVVASAVPMRAFASSSELWSFTGDTLTFSCPPSELVKALAVSPTEVQLDFQRAIDPKSLLPNGGSFSISGGLTVLGQSVSGTRVTLQTSMQTARAPYEITIDSKVRDVLGGSVDVPSNTRGFVGYFPRAVLMLNEIDCNADSERDLIELVVKQAGSTADLQLTYDGEQKSDVLMTFPDAQVDAGDLIVVHLNADGLKGDAVYSETVSKNEQSASTNYPNAWDFVIDHTTCKSEAAVLRIRTPRGDTQDGVPIYRSDVKPSARPAAFGSTWLRGLQLEQQWSPTTCAGNWCSETSSPSSLEISVDTAGTGTIGSTRYSVARKSDADTNSRADWATSKVATFGAPNF